MPITSFSTDMAFPVQFDNQARSGAVKVSDVPRKGRLPPELEAGEATAAKFAPEAFLGRSHIAAEFAGTLGMKMALSHGSRSCPLTPGPSPPRGEGRKIHWLIGATPRSKTSTTESMRTKVVAAACGVFSSWIVVTPLVVSTYQSTTR